MKLSRAGDCLERCGVALRRGDSIGYAAATDELSRRLVASGFGVHDGDERARVRLTTERLKSLLARAAMPGASSAERGAVDSIALACANIDTRAERFGSYPPLPQDEPEKSTETNGKRRASRKPSEVENGVEASAGSSGDAVPSSDSSDRDERNPRA